MGDKGPTSGSGTTHGVRDMTVGTLIGMYALLDAYVIGIPLTILAAETNALIVFIVAAVALIPVNVAACSWIDRHWGGWTAAGGGSRLEARIQKVRNGRILRHPASWTTRASVGWFTLAAVLLNAVVAVALARVVGGQPVGPTKVRAAATGYSVFFAGLFCAIGFAAGDIL